MDARGEECDTRLEPTATLTPVTKPTGFVLASVGKASVGPAKLAKSAIQQVNPENQIVGCADGEDTTGRC